MKDLERLFRPRSVAILGASDRNPWGGIALRTLEEAGFTGPVHLVNRRGSPALGRETIRSCADAAGEIDAAFIAVPAGAMIEALEDMAAGGVRFGAVVTSGFAELGAEGAALQTEIFDRAAQLGITLLGPNSLGFTNFVDRVALGTMPMPKPTLPDRSLAVVGQSGATSVLLAQAAHGFGYGLTHIITMGNEAMIDLADVVQFLVADAETKAICIFAETIRNPSSFLAAAAAAFHARKPIIMMKVGVGELTATVAQAHTGALVGDDNVFQAMCDAYNIVRVNSLEDLVITAATLGAIGPIDPDKGFALVSMSGGACEIVADRGEEAGIPFPQFRPETIERMRGVLADFGAAHNPLDITGAAMARPELFHDLMRIIDKDGQFALMGVLAEVATDKAQESPVSRACAFQIARAMNEGSTSVAVWQQSIKQVSTYGRDYIAEFGFPLVTSGLDHSVRATGKLWEWSRGFRRALPGEQVSGNGTARPEGEYALLGWLGSQGVPVIPQSVATSRADAIRLAAALKTPAVLKVLSPDVAHKTEVGGVRLNLSGEVAVGEAYDAILAAVKAARPAASIEGVLVSPMRSGGLELIVGVARDPVWGLVLALGLGGVWVEVLKDSRLMILPVSEAQVVEALGQLKAAQLLQGYRGAVPADLGAIARAVCAICNAALELGSGLETLEINPLRVDGAQVEALDALAVWS